MSDKTDVPRCTRCNYAITNVFHPCANCGASMPMWEVRLDRGLDRGHRDFIKVDINEKKGMKFPDNKSKVLVLCQEGNVRSVGLAFRLKGHYDFRDILTSGVLRISDETKCVLWDWADVIFVVGEPKLLAQLGMFVKDKKVVHVNVGNDVWGNPYDPDLQRTLQRELEEIYEDAKEIYKGYL